MLLLLLRIVRFASFTTLVPQFLLLVSAAERALVQRRSPFLANKQQENRRRNRKIPVALPSRTVTQRLWYEIERGIVVVGTDCAEGSTSGAYEILFLVAVEEKVTTRLGSCSVLNSDV